MILRTPFVRVLSVAALALLPLTAALPTTEAAPSDSSPAAGAVLFQDDFTGVKGAKPTAGAWSDYSACSYNSSAAFGNIQCGSPERLDGNGHLIVPGKANPSLGQAIRTTGSWTYGVFSAWVRLPTQTGYWPAFWSLNSEYTGTSTLPVGEVDGLEAYTTFPTKDYYWHTTSHSYVSAGTFNDGDNACAAGLTTTTGFTKMTFRIAPNEITYYVNDVQCGDAFTPADTGAGNWAWGPSNTDPNWLILQLATGGAGGQNGEPTVNGRMLVDRVEVRALS